MDDPGGNFASDDHRRVQAIVPQPTEEPLEVDELAERIVLDGYSEVNEADELTEYLEDLEAEGDVTHLKDGWRQTKRGFEALTGPIATDGGRTYG